MAADAGVVKTTVDGRWPWKEALVAHAVRRLCADEVCTVDTGDLAADLIGPAKELYQLLRPGPGPVAGRPHSDVCHEPGPRRGRAGDDRHPGARRGRRDGCRIRRRRGDRPCSRPVEPVAHAAHRPDVARVRRGVADLGAQPLDRHVDQPGVAEVVVARHTSKPSGQGIIRSRTNRSNGCDMAVLMPVPPSGAPTVVKPARSRRMATTSRTEGLSSMTRTDVPLGPAPSPIGAGSALIIGHPAADGFRDALYGGRGPNGATQPAV